MLSCKDFKETVSGLYAILAAVHFKETVSRMHIIRAAVHFNETVSRKNATWATNNLKETFSVMYRCFTKIYQFSLFSQLVPSPTLSVNDVSV